MARLIRFGDGDYLYDFTATDVYVQSFSDNFKSMVTQTVRLPSADGGYDQYGSRRTPLEIGSVRAEITLVDPTTQAMDGLRRDIAQMAGWGVRKLYRSADYQDAGSLQWCYARLDNQTIARNEKDYTDIFQPVPIVWQVAEPGWFAQNKESWVWGGATWGSDKWGGDATTQAVSGTSTDYTETVAGNFPTLPRIEVIPGSGNSCTNIKIRRLVSGAVVDELSYTGTITDTDSLLFDCRRKSVTLNGSDAYSDSDYRRGNWFELEPGDNSIRVIMENGGDAASVIMRYYARFLD